jgi:hypothetical protein
MSVDTRMEHIMTLLESPLTLEAMQWARLDYIDNVRPIDDTDAPCLEEIRQVLERHGALSRFGVALLHSHFEVAADEMMLETTDTVKRVHLVQPVKRADVEAEGFTVQTTIVGFDEHGFHQNCGCRPMVQGHGHPNITV